MSFARADSWRERIVRYPLHWRALDVVNQALDRMTTPRVAAATPLIMLMPALLLVGLLLFGVAMIVEQSFHKLDPDTFLLAKAYSAANYAVVLARSHYRELLWRTGGSALLVTVICIALGFPYAYFMIRVRSAVTKKLLLCGVFLPFLLGGVVRGYAWLVILGQDGLINNMLKLLGLPGVPLIYNMTGVLIGLAQLYLPLSIMMIAPALTAINEEIDEAAQSLGAHWTRVLWSVIMPMAAPGMLRAFVVVLTLVFSDMTIPAILGGGRADFITNAVYQAYLETGDRGVGAALCVVTTLIATGSIALMFGVAGVIAKRRVRR